jgi:hypothetical protein
MTQRGRIGREGVGGGGRDGNKSLKHWSKNGNEKKSKRKNEGKFIGERWGGGVRGLRFGLRN